MEAVPPWAVLAMLGSALTHSGMTLLTKRAKDKLVFRGLTLGFVGLAFLPWLLTQPLPSWEVWRFLIAGAVVIWAFNMLLIAAFTEGEMNLAYPVMRGSAPALAAIVAFIFLGETISTGQMLGLAIATTALIGFAWPEKDGKPKLKLIVLALSAACMTAAYSVIDAAGVRESGRVLVYLGWFFVLSVVTILPTAMIRRGKDFWAAARQEARPALFSTVFNTSTYGLALLAYAHAPVAPMAALRETSIVFGAILAALVLKESFGLRRIALAICLAGGLVLLQVM
ncbi:DMT family transporter [Maricaulis parjimensis]|uniref:DMT family transporter n=1 Tax=Maricaulis parjimensis TaxID=144023 RepID=UPI0019394383|nr:DMT family transporter [Maricaulis parjimensis]